MHSLSSPLKRWQTNEQKEDQCRFCQAITPINTITVETSSTTNNSLKSQSANVHRSHAKVDGKWGYINQE